MVSTQKINFLTLVSYLPPNTFGVYLAPLLSCTGWILALRHSKRPPATWKFQSRLIFFQMWLHFSPASLVRISANFLSVPRRTTNMDQIRGIGVSLQICPTPKSKPPFLESRVSEFPEISCIPRGRQGLRACKNFLKSDEGSWEIWAQIWPKMQILNPRISRKWGRSPADKNYFSQDPRAITPMDQFGGSPP